MHMWTGYISLFFSPKKVAGIYIARISLWSGAYIPLASYIVIVYPTYVHTSHRYLLVYGIQTPLNSPSGLNLCGYADRPTQLVKGIPVLEFTLVRTYMPLSLPPNSLTEPLPLISSTDDIFSTTYLYNHTSPIAILATLTIPASICVPPQCPSSISLSPPFMISILHTSLSISISPLIIEVPRSIHLPH